MPTKQPSYQQAFNNYAQMAPGLEEAIFGAQKKVEAATELQSAAVTASAVANAQSTQLFAEGIIAEQEAHKRLLREVGLDISDPASSLNAELRKEAETRRARETLRSEITSKQGASLFGNPIQFIMNMVELPQLVAQHNELADVENRATSEVARMQQLATTVLSLTPAKNADLLRAKAVADAEKVKQDAAATAAQISAQNAAGHAKALLDTFTLRRNMFGDIMQMSQFRQAQANHADSMRMQEKRYNLDVQQFNLSRQDRLDRQAAIEEAKNADNAIVTGINLYRKTINGNVPEYTLEDVKRMPPQEKQLWFDILRRGNYGNDYATSVPTIDAIGNLAGAAQSGNAQMVRQVQSLRMRAEERAREIQNQSKLTGGGAIKTDDALRQAYTELYKKDLAFSAKGSIKNDLTAISPYAFDLDGIAQQAAASKDKSFIGTLLAEAKARNPSLSLTQTYRAPLLLADVQAKVVAGAIDPKIAAQEVARFFALQTGQQYEQAGLKYLGLPPAVDWTIVPTDSKKEVDLMNPVQLERYLTFSAAKTRSRNSMLDNAKALVMPFGVNIIDNIFQGKNALGLKGDQK